MCMYGDSMYLDLKANRQAVVCWVLSKNPVSAHIPAEMLIWYLSYELVVAWYLHQ